MSDHLSPSGIPLGDASEGPMRDRTLDLVLSPGDLIDLAGGSVTVSLPGARRSLRIRIRDEGPAVGAIGCDGSRVSYSGEPIGTVREPAAGADAAELRVELGPRATTAAVEALLESFLVEDPTGGDAVSWRAVSTVRDARGQAARCVFALRSVTGRGGPPGAIPSRAPRAAERVHEDADPNAFLLADAASDTFVFATPRD